MFCFVGFWDCLSVDDFEILVGFVLLVDDLVDSWWMMIVVVWVF